MACDILSVEKRKEDSGSNLQSKLKNLDAKSGFIADVIVAHEDEPNLMESDKEPNHAFASQIKQTQLTFDLQSEYQVDKENEKREAKRRSRGISSAKSITSCSATGKVSPKNFLEGRTHQTRLPALNFKSTHTNDDSLHRQREYARYPKSPQRPKHPTPGSLLSALPNQLQHSQVQENVRFDPKSDSFNASAKRPTDGIMTVRALKLCDSKNVIVNAKVATALQKGSKLSFQLNLSNCGIRDFDLVYIFSPVNKKTFQNRTEINISNNQITVDGISIILSRIFEMGLKIGVIDASKNQLNESTLPVILNFVKNRKNDLTDIDLRQNSIDPAKMADLVQEIRICGVMVLL